MTSSASRKARVAQEKLQRKLEREPVVLEFKYAPGALAYHGPVINTDLTITPDYAQALEKAGVSIPRPVTCRFLIDTGADGSVVKHEIAERAGLKLINDNYPLQGVGIDTTGKAYMGRIVFVYVSKIVDSARHTIFVDTEVMGARLESDSIDGLIGRDVLAHFDFSYDGKTGVVRIFRMMGRRASFV